MKEHYTITENEDLITKFEFLKDMPGHYAVFDSLFFYKAMSPNHTAVLGWHTADDAINTTVYDVPGKIVSGAHLYHKYLNVTTQLKKKTVAIQVVDTEAGVLILVSQEIPIIDNNNVMRGIFYSGIDLTNIFQNRYKWLEESDNKFVGYKEVPKQYILTPEASPLPLTHRQQECLALLIRGKTYKEIAYMLGISNRVVEDHIHAIKYKLGCYNKSQLIEKAIDSGFLFHVPETLFGLLK